MKTICLFLIVTIITISCSAQSTIDSAFHFTFYNSLNYNPPIGTHAPVGPDYGCLSSQTNRPIWFYFTVCGADSGTVPAEVAISYNVHNGAWQFGLILWGPFDDTINIASKLTASNIDTCIPILGFTTFLQLHHLQFPKIYYGMFSMTDNVQFGGMDRMWTGSYWFDDRCGICNSRVANYKQDICMVTLDTSTQKNMIIWDKKYNFEISSFNIYREGVVAGQFDSIGNVSVNDYGVFIDNGVNPNQQSYKYRMSGLDSCASTSLKYNQYNDSALVHATIHLQASPGLNNEVNLSWNPYVGFPYGTFYIYRGSSPNLFQILDSVSASTYSYTDYNAQAGLNYYKVTSRKPDGCSPDGGTTVYHEARSNNPYTNNVGIDELYHSFYFKVSPNPANDDFNISFSKNIKDGIVVLFNVMGEKVYSENFNGTQVIINCKLNEGIYFVRVTEGNDTLTQKIIKQ